MAVYQGTRLRSATLADRRPERRAVRAVALPDQRIESRVRAAARPVVAAVPRPRPAALLMAGILAATMVGFAYLTQTLSSNATSAEIVVLEDRLQDLAQEVRHQEALVVMWQDTELEPAAAKLGLKQHGDPVTLKAP
jgi:hypothetical protein